MAIKNSCFAAAFCSALLWVSTPATAAAEVPAAVPLAKSAPEPEPAMSFDLGVDTSDRGSPESKRVTLSHEVSVKASGSADVVNNRSALRLEYSRFFLENYFVQFDAKLNSFWSNDHRAQAEQKSVLVEPYTQEAFLQYSGNGGKTSVKLGMARLIWGESEGGAITDEVSPRNFSELFFIPLEEARLGQAMLNVDHFSRVGDWSFFFIPKPRFNKYPKAGTEYYVNPLADIAVVHETPSHSDDNEFGMRWKKTFGKSDISFMAASLIDNDHVLRFDGMTPDNRLQLLQLNQRFMLSGMTFNYSRGDVLVKGEVGLKSNKGFNDTAFGVIQKDVLSSSLGLTYSLGHSDTVGVEWVSSRILDWEERLVGTARTTNTAVLNVNLFFLNDTLTVNWLSLYNRPHASYQSALRVNYKWSDGLTVGMSAFFIDAPDAASALHVYRRQDQLSLRVQYQF